MCEEQVLDRALGRESNMIRSILTPLYCLLDVAVLIGSDERNEDVKSTDHNSKIRIISIGAVFYLDLSCKVKLILCAILPSLLRLILRQPVTRCRINLFS